MLLFTSARQLGRRAPGALVAEARHGLSWLSKMWDPTTRTLHIQVGIGSGNEQGTFRGDHDGWRLPQADDHNTANEDRYVSHRPVFDAAPAGKPISPNLVGRVAASYALAAQLDARNHHSRALAELHQAQLLYSRADTASPPNPLVTALPHDFYPEDTWRDDMELGAAEIALARQGLHLGNAGFVAKSAHWANAYLNGRPVTRSTSTTPARSRTPRWHRRWGTGGTSLSPGWTWCATSARRSAAAYATRLATRSRPASRTTTSTSTPTPTG